MKVFAVNLPQKTERKAHILSQGEKHHLNIEVIEAVNGALLTDEQLHQLVRDYPACYLTKGEVGCALSHLKIYKKMIDENCPVALVLEDDALLGDDINKVLQALSQIEHNKKPQVYLLSGAHHYIETGKKLLVEPYAMHQIVGAFYTYAYVINLEAAKALYEFLRPVTFEADRWVFMQQLGVTSVYAIEPAVVQSCDENKSSSAIEGERHAATLNRAAYVRQLKKQFPLCVRLKKAYWKLIKKHFVTTKKRPQY